MKVLMTTDTIGGVWTYAVCLATQIIARGGEVALVTAGRSLSSAQRRSLERLHKLQVFETHYRLEWMHDAWDDVDAMGEALLGIEKMVRPDVVHLNDYSHGCLPWHAPVLVTGHSCVLSWHEATRHTSAGREWQTYRDRVRAGLGGADIVVAPTAWMLEQLELHYGALDAYAVISNGHDLDSNLSDGAAEKQPFIFSAGRLWDEAKNIATLCDAAMSVRWPILIAGDLVHPENRHVAMLRHVRLLGALSADEMRARYAAASIYALPARYEPFGLTALEAAARGAALVLSDIESLREVWGDAAVYVRSDHPLSWAAALNALVADGKRRVALATAARQRAARYSAEAMADRYLDTYRKLVSAAARGVPAKPRDNASARDAQNMHGGHAEAASARDAEAAQHEEGARSCAS